MHPRPPDGRAPEPGPRRWEADPMASVWSYEGKRVLVTGGGGAGMGAAAVRDLVDLGAEVHVFDLKEPPVDVASYRNVDLRDPQAMADAVAALGGPITGLFNC